MKTARSRDDRDGCDTDSCRITATITTAQVSAVGAELVITVVQGSCKTNPLRHQFGDRKMRGGYLISYTDRDLLGDCFEFNAGSVPGL